jgi:hypothetical protein
MVLVWSRVVRGQNREDDMAKHHQWHSARDGERVHHDNDDCDDGQYIDYYWLRHNSGGRPLCETCAQLNAAEAHDFRRRASMTQTSA